METFTKRLAHILAEHEVNKLDDPGTRAQEADLKDTYFKEYYKVLLEGTDDMELVELIHNELGTEAIIEELNFVASDFYGEALKAFYEEEGADAVIQELDIIAPDIVAVEVGNIHDKRELTSIMNKY